MLQVLVPLLVALLTTLGLIIGNFTVFLDGVQGDVDEIENKIDLRLAPAVETLDGLLEEPDGANGYDFAFIDADKENYGVYYERCLRLIRPGGLIAIDNTLWAGVPRSDMSGIPPQVLQHEPMLSRIVLITLAVKSLSLITAIL